MRSAASAAAALAIVLALAAPAGAAEPAATTPYTTPPSPGGTQAPSPPEITAAQAKGIAAQVPKIAAVRRSQPRSTLAATRKPDQRWEVAVWSGGSPSKQIGLVTVDGTGHVVEAWTGFQVAWGMARGYPGAFGRTINTTWIWVTLCVLFVLPFVDVRRPWRMLHLDLLALVGFSVSLAFFNDANLGLSVPLSAPLLAYLLARLLWIGLRRHPAAPEPLRLLVPWPWLAGATLFLIGFRVGLNMVDGNVIDVGYAGTIGADKLAHARELWGAFPSDNVHGDTYGPLLYLAYVPFELIWPWHGHWDDLPSAHAAAAVFDLACVALLFAIGRRLRGNALGAALAYAWVTFPFTIFATNSGTNDALPAALVLAALYLHLHPFRRGALVAAAGLTKFAPLALLPLFASHGLRSGASRSPRRALAAFAAGVAVVAAAGAAIVLWHGDPSTFWDRTLGYQAGRDAPFSVWGFYGGGWSIAQHVVEAAAVLLAVGIAFVPRRDDLVGLAACAGAVLVAFQLAATYWFYLYLIWVLPLALIAYLGRLPAPEPRPVAVWLNSPIGGTAAAPARSSPPVGAPSSG